MILIRIFLEKMQDNAETSDDIKDRAEFVFRMDDGSRRRFVSEARRIIACRLVKDYGILLSEIARRVGVSTSAVSKMISSVAN